ncbi:putative inactive receptor kinase [Iris pallida]|uniref:Inactive receptor kinase n=1 Tax=Iris pallida TaxID=29817 RepID=A0AAX6EFP9_IRIPA|nr:putative inactive receptor kinase [Iris pallida]
MGSHHLPMSTLLFLLLLLLAHRGAPDLAADRAALLSLRAAVGRSALNWNSTTDSSPCSFSGVTCEGGRVTALHLPGTGLLGAIPAGLLGNLTALRTLSLRFNALAGPLPADVSSLSELRNLYLQSNRFSGEIPESIFSLQNLVRLNLADNNFTGRISPGINKLTRLGTLYLEKNSLSGEMPAIDLPNLVQFNVSFNRLNGSVPEKLRSMPRDSFLGTGLCGGPGPLGACLGEVSPAAAGVAKRHKLSGGAVAGIAIGAAVGFLVLLALVLLLCRRRGGGGKTKPAGVASEAERLPEAEMALTDKRVVDAAPAVPPANGVGEKRLVFFGSGPRVYDLEDLLRASAEVLGKGTFGTTYKAVLESGNVVAVKRLKEANIPEVEFREKIAAIGAMEHKNLVGLRAYYYSKDERLLVYEYMSMGSLSSLLHGNRGAGRTPLNWDTRSSIALDAARGIEYIHSTSPTASHGNIKSSNILLDRSYEARVSDHGLATLANPTPIPNRVAGYRAPEITDVRKVSQKADVYSFGVLLLELLTGKAPAQALLNEEGVDLPRWVQSVVKEEWTSEVFDLELLRYQNVEEEMVQLLQLAIDCAAQYPDRRPTMSEVVGRIEEIQQSSMLASADEKEDQADSV